LRDNRNSSRRNPREEERRGRGKDLPHSKALSVESGGTTSEGKMEVLEMFREGTIKNEG